MRTRTSDRLDAVVALTEGPRVLHIGCGGARKVGTNPKESRWLHGLLCEQFDEVWGIDTNGPGIERLKDAGFSNVFHMAAEEFNIDATFDTIVAGEVIEHLTDPGSFLRHVRKHLKPGGRLVLTTPFAFSLGFMIYAWLRWPKTCSNDDHKMWFCPTTLNQLAEASGLRTSHVELSLNYPDHLPPSRSSWKHHGYRVWRSLLLGGTRIGLVPTRVTGNSMVVVLQP